MKKLIGINIIAIAFLLPYQAGAQAGIKTKSTNRAKDCREAIQREKALIRKANRTVANQKSS